MTIAPERPTSSTLSVADAARILGISRNHAYKAVARGEIPSIRIGGKILVPRQALREMLLGKNTG